MKGYVKKFLQILSMFALTLVGVLGPTTVCVAVYNLLIQIPPFTNLQLVLIIEGFVMMLLGFLAHTNLPQKGTVGFPWSQSVRAAKDEIRGDRVKQVDFWMFIGTVGITIFIIGLILS